MKNVGGGHPSDSHDPFWCNPKFVAEKISGITVTLCVTFFKPLSLTISIQWGTHKTGEEDPG